MLARSAFALFCSASALFCSASALLCFALTRHCCLLSVLCGDRRVEAGGRARMAMASMEIYQALAQRDVAVGLRYGQPLHAPSYQLPNGTNPGTGYKHHTSSTSNNTTHNHKNNHQRQEQPSATAHHHQPQPQPEPEPEPQPEPEHPVSVTNILTTQAVLHAAKRLRITGAPPLTAPTGAATSNAAAGIQVPLTAVRNRQHNTRHAEETVAKHLNHHQYKKQMQPKPLSMRAALVTERLAAHSSSSRSTCLENKRRNSTNMRQHEEEAQRAAHILIAEADMNMRSRARSQSAAPSGIGINTVPPIVADALLLPPHTEAEKASAALHGTSRAVLLTQNLRQRKTCETGGGGSGWRGVKATDLAVRDRIKDQAVIAGSRASFLIDQADRKIANAIISKRGTAAYARKGRTYDSRTEGNGAGPVVQRSSPAVAAVRAATAAAIAAKQAEAQVRLYVEGGVAGTASAASRRKAEEKRHGPRAPTSERVAPLRKERNVGFGRRNREVTRRSSHSKSRPLADPDADLNGRVVEAVSTTSISGDKIDTIQTMANRPNRSSSEENDEEEIKRMRRASHTYFEKHGYTGDADLSEVESILTATSDEDGPVSVLSNTGGYKGTDDKERDRHAHTSGTVTVDSRRSRAGKESELPRPLMRAMDRLPKASRSRLLTDLRHCGRIPEKAYVSAVCSTAHTKADVKQQQLPAPRQCAQSESRKNSIAGNICTPQGERQAGRSRAVGSGDRMMVRSHKLDVPEPVIVHALPTAVLGASGARHSQRRDQGGEADVSATNANIVHASSTKHDQPSSQAAILDTVYSAVRAYELAENHVSERLRVEPVRSKQDVIAGLRRRLSPKKSITLVQRKNRGLEDFSELDSAYIANILEGKERYRQYLKAKDGPMQLLHAGMNSRRLMSRNLDVSSFSSVLGDLMVEEAVGGVLDELSTLCDSFVEGMALEEFGLGESEASLTGTGPNDFVAAQRLYPAPSVVAADGGGSKEDATVFVNNAASGASTLYDGDEFSNAADGSTTEGYSDDSHFES